jgi:glyoxylase-like metal-dependent hydrolase (beta-lactamase superfamily II)
MIYDERTRLLLAGDSLYPGRLYVPSNLFLDYRDSIDRLVAFTRNHKVSHILGAHIEMTREPGKDFRDLAPSHPDEHVLELPVADLLELQAAVHRMGDAAVRDVHPDFIVQPLPPRTMP